MDEPPIKQMSFAPIRAPTARLVALCVYALLPICFRGCLFFLLFLFLPPDRLPGHDDAKALSDVFSEEQADSKCLSLLSEPAR